MLGLCFFVSVIRLGLTLLESAAVASEAKDLEFERNVLVS